MPDSTSQRKNRELRTVDPSESMDSEDAADSGNLQADLFMVLDTSRDWPIKDDVSSMEYPIFSLSKKRDTEMRVYSRAGRTVRVIPSAAGAATVFDKDLLIYCLSKIVKRVDAGEPVSRRVRVDVYPFLVGTNRSTGGAAYERVVEMCRRLKGTTIETNIKTSKKEQVEGFGLIEDYRVTNWTKNGKGALELELTISEWLHRAATEFDVLTLHPKYFRLAQPMERRLYELARKHCGGQAWWEIGIPLLQEKIGSSQTSRRFKHELKDISERNPLPEYRVYVDESTKPNKLVVMTRDTARLMSEASKAGKIAWISGLVQKAMLSAEGKAAG